MQKEIRCPHCGGNRYQQIGNGICKCSYCGSTFACTELQIESSTIKKEIKSHYLIIAWKGIPVLLDASINLEINEIHYNNASLGNGFSIKVPVQSVMNIVLSCGLVSSKFSFSLNPDYDYEMNLEYSHKEKWFTSYYLKEVDKNIVITSGEIEKQTQKTTDLEGRKIAFIIICTLFLLLIICVIFYIF